MGPQAPPPYPPPPPLPGRASVADASFYSEKAKNWGPQVPKLPRYRGSVSIFLDHTLK